MKWIFPEVARNVKSYVWSICVQRLALISKDVQE